MVIVGWKHAHVRVRRSPPRPGPAFPLAGVARRAFVLCVCVCRARHAWSQIPQYRPHGWRVARARTARHTVCARGTRWGGGASALLCLFVCLCLRVLCCVCACCVVSAGVVCLCVRLFVSARAVLFCVFSARQAHALERARADAVKRLHVQALGHGIEATCGADGLRE